MAARAQDFDYTDVPFRAGGRDLTGWDCYGCAWYVAGAEFGRAWPSYAGAYRTDPLDYDELRALILGELDQFWQELGPREARPGDLVVLNLRGRPIHVGLLVSPTRVLHADRMLGTVRERLDGAYWRRRIESVHRHA